MLRLQKGDVNMTKLLLEVFCPATNKSYDFWVSKKLTIAEVRDKFAYEIAHKEKSTDLFKDPERVLLFSTKFGALDLRYTLAGAGLCSGDTLILF